LAVRIYALAKDLKLDSKELVDICTKAGVPGKGSALASLTEDEVERVKQFLKGDGPKGKPAKAAPVAPQRPAEPPRTGKMPVIVTSRPSTPPPRPKAPEPGPEPAPTSTPAPIAATSTAVETATSSSSATATAVAEAPRRPGPLAGAMGREKYFGPGQVSGKVPVVGKESRSSERKKADGPATTERARPAVKLAPKGPSRWRHICAVTNARWKKKRSSAA
jgi:translation initiation factor IF-2